VEGRRGPHPDQPRSQDNPGVIPLRSSLSIAQAIDEIAAIAVASDAEEWNNQIAYLPFR